MVSPDSVKPGAKSKSLAKKAKCGMAKKTSKSKNRGKIVSMKSTSTNAYPEELRRPQLRKTSTSSPHRLVSAVTGKKQVQRRVG